MSEPSVRAEVGEAQVHASQRSRGRLLLVLVLVAALVVGAGAWWTGRSDSDVPSVGPDDTTSNSDSAGLRDARAIEALARQETALHDDSRASYLAGWDSSTPRSQRRAHTTYTNLRALDIGSLRPRYVAAVSGLGEAAHQRLGGQAWIADVQVEYDVLGFGRPARTTVRYTFALRDDRAHVVDVRAAPGERRPIWTLGPLVVRRTPRTLVAAQDEALAARASGALTESVSDVQAVLPRWRGSLVAFVPGGVRAFEAVIAATPGSYNGIAAVTTTVDGSTDAAAPVAIVLNGPVFARLGPVGTQVVSTHEATHAATGAATVSMPLWIAEGFADYVGVGAVDVPLRISAGEVLRSVRRTGLPRQLPADSAFDAAGTDLNVTYQQAWLATRLIARQYGESALIAFYRDVKADPADVDRAFARLGTSRADFTRDWRDELDRLAS